jgi:hypothetical protein
LATACLDSSTSIVASISSLSMFDSNEFLPEEFESEFELNSSDSNEFCDPKIWLLNLLLGKKLKNDLV